MKKKLEIQLKGNFDSVFILCFRWVEKVKQKIVKNVSQTTFLSFVESSIFVFPVFSNDYTNLIFYVFLHVAKDCTQCYD